MKLFLGLQIHQSLRGIFINQAKYTLEILHKHGMDKGQSIGTPIATKPKLDADLSGNPVDQTDFHSKIGSLMYLTSSRPDIVQAGSSFELTAFSDADHAGCIDTCKSTSGGIQFLGDKLVSWMSKKQNCTAMSSTEAEYVALSASCAQVMWMRTQLQDYGFNYNKIPLYCDSQTEYQLADMFTKALPEDRFKYLVRRIDEHLARFHGIKDAKTIWAAIKTKFGEGLDKGYDRFQRLLSLLEIHRAECTSRTNELNDAYSVSTAIGHSSQAQGSSSYADELMFSFFANQSSSPQLDIKDLEQINQDDLEEMDLKWQVECFNCHRRGHFARDFRSARNSGNRSRDVRNAGYIGRNNEEEATVFALMAFTSNPSSSSCSNFKENSLANDRFKKGEGYHVVPPPLTGNYMPPKSDLSFARLDDFIYKFKISETVTSVTKAGKDAPETSTTCADKPKEDRSSASLIQDWDTNSDNDNRMAKKSVLPNNMGKGTGYKESRPVWNNVHKINHQNKFTSTVVFIRFGRIPVSAAKPKVTTSTSAAKPVNTAGPKQSVQNPEGNLVRGLPSKILKMTILVLLVKRESSTKPPVRPRLLAQSANPYRYYIWIYMVQHLALVKKSHNKTPYELLNGRTHRLDFMRPFGYPITILNTLDPLGKFKVSVGNQTDKKVGPQDTNGNADDTATDDKPKDDTSSKTVEEPVNIEDQVYIDELGRLMSQEKEASDAMDAFRKESIQRCMDQRGATKAGSTNPVNIDTAELRSTSIFNSTYDDDLDIFSSPVQSVGAEADFNNIDSSIVVSPIPTHRVHIDHPKNQILGDPKSAIQIRRIANKTFGAHALVNKNKKDERGIVVRNKARLVAQGHRQEEGIDYDEVFALVARIEVIRLFLAFASFMGFIVYQMDVKSAFLYGTIEEEVYVSQPPSFIDPQFPSKVYKCKKQTIVATSNTEAEYVAAANCCGQVL
uniref:Reverse transcriptase Ty1/copia-type domain-containing protein n=1 Tax=Tanacetum cinerariifolium TaxID=118510 RepID=A0A6L2K335_TANCI|nr:hypothetical protein [Tanacetum cinerariifolium]